MTNDSGRFGGTPCIGIQPLKIESRRHRARGDLHEVVPRAKRRYSPWRLATAQGPKEESLPQ